MYFLYSKVYSNYITLYRQKKSMSEILAYPKNIDRLGIKVMYIQ